jgi:hypothetical protein
MLRSRLRLPSVPIFIASLLVGSVLFLTNACGDDEEEAQQRAAAQAEAERKKKEEAAKDNTFIPAAAPGQPGLPPGAGPYNGPPRNPDPPPNQPMEAGRDTSAPPPSDAAGQ